MDLTPLHTPWARGSRAPPKRLRGLTFRPDEALSSGLRQSLCLIERKYSLATTSTGSEHREERTAATGSYACRSRDKQHGHEGGLSIPTRASAAR